MKRYLIVLAAAALLVSCGRGERTSRKKQQNDQMTRNGYEQQIAQWREHRRAGLLSDNGWLTLVGLHWLAEGENTFGSAETSRVVLEAHVPPQCGTLLLRQGSVVLTPAPDVQMSIDDKRVNGAVTLVPDTDPKGPTIVSLGTVRFHAIKRNDRFALRVKDRASDARQHFAGLEYFPADPKWRVKARFEPFQPPRHIPITNVLGMTSDEVAPGMLVFSIDGREVRLEPILEQGEKDLFIIFKDATAGKETYAAARYVYAAPAGPDGTTVIDFNKAYNPPCAFTPFATCPLPPPQNRLPLRIEAGEKKYAGH